MLTVRRLEAVSSTTLTGQSLRAAGGSEADGIAVLTTSLLQSSCSIPSGIPSLLPRAGAVRAGLRIRPLRPDVSLGYLFGRHSEFFNSH